MGLFEHKYPYTDAHELNLDWIIEQVKKVTKEVDDFKVINQIRFFGTWDISKQYPAWAFVDDGTGFGYLSIKPVPSGVMIDNEDYWRMVANYSTIYANFQNRIIALESSDVTIQAEIDTINDKIDIINDNVKFFENKNILIIGDSISDEAVYPPNWVTCFRNKVEPVGATVKNISVSGKSIGSNTAGSGGLLDYINAEPSGIGMYDMIIFFAGVNDFQNQRKFGSYSSGDRTTFFGAFYELYNTLTSKWGVIPVYVCTIPYSINHVSDKTWAPPNFYRCIMEKVCRRYGWTMIDTTNLPNYNIWDPSIQPDISDGLHFKAPYSPIVCDRIINQIVAGGTPSIGDFADVITFDTFDLAGLTGTLKLYVHTDGRVMVEMYFTAIPDAAKGQTITIINSIQPALERAYALVFATQYQTISMTWGNAGISMTMPNRSSMAVRSQLIDWIEDYQAINY